MNEMGVVAVGKRNKMKIAFHDGLLSHFRGWKKDVKNEVYLHNE